MRQKTEEGYQRLPASSNLDRARQSYDHPLALQSRPGPSSRLLPSRQTRVAHVPSLKIAGLESYTQLVHVRGIESFTDVAV